MEVLNSKIRFNCLSSGQTFGILALQTRKAFWTLYLKSQRWRGRTWDGGADGGLKVEGESGETFYKIIGEKTVGSKGRELW